MSLMTLSFIGSLFFVIGLLFITSAFLHGSRTDGGRKALSSVKKWQKRKEDIWDISVLDKLTDVLSKLIFVEETEEDKYNKKISRAGLTITAKKFISRKYVIIGLSVIIIIFFALMKFFIGVLLTVLVAAYFLLKHRASLDDLIKSKDLAINTEMPKFVRTICRNIPVDRDIYSVLSTYRKIAGDALGSELDILLAELSTINAQNALAHFENRIGTPDAYRLCSALKNISNGIDQASALMYLSEDMSKYARENIRRELSLYPGKMKRSMLPATFVTVLILIYILGAFIIQRFSNVF